MPFFKKKIVILRLYQVAPYLTFSKFYSSLPLSSAHKYLGIYLELFIWDNYRVIFITRLVTTILLLNEIYRLTELPFYWLMMQWEFLFGLLDDLILGFRYINLSSHRLSPLHKKQTNKQSFLATPIDDAQMIEFINWKNDGVHKSDMSLLFLFILLWNLPSKYQHSNRRINDWR